MGHGGTGIFPVWRTG